MIATICYANFSRQITEQGTIPLTDQASKVKGSYAYTKFARSRRGTWTASIFDTADKQVTLTYTNAKGPCADAGDNGLTNGYSGANPNGCPFDGATHTKATAHFPIRWFD